MIAAIYEANEKRNKKKIRKTPNVMKMIKFSVEIMQRILHQGRTSWKLCAVSENDCYENFEITPKWFSANVWFYHELEALMKVNDSVWWLVTNRIA